MTEAVCGSVVLRLGEEEGSATDGGRQTPDELDYASLMKGDRRHSLPPPISLCAHTKSDTDIRTLSNCSLCLSHLDYLILFKLATCRGLKDRTPAYQRTLSYKNAWHKNRTDVLFK